MYRLMNETLLGLNLEGDRLRLTPRLPNSWTKCKIDYRYRETTYHITISRFPDGLPGSGQTYLDGTQLTDRVIPLADDHREHTVEMRLPSAS
jgi:cellobiose phosphorylase